MKQKLLDGLKDLGYSGPLVEKTSFDSALQEGSKSVEFTKLVNFLTNELRTLLNIDEEVNPISSPEDSVSFVMEVSSFLKELNCPYTALTQGHISDRLESQQDKLLLLDYLSTELMAARILQEKKPDKKFELKLQETEEAANMRKILMTLRFHKPPPNITIPQLFQKVCPTVQTTVQKVGNELVGKPAFQGTLSDKQWETLNGVQKDLNNEYKIRREMLLTRLDVTIQSFQWSDKTKGKDELFEKVYTEKRKRLKTEPEVELADLLAARDDIAIIEKTSSSSVRKNTKSSLNKVIIGQVPDRGGRTSEQAPPPPEMPSWQQRTPGPSGGGRGRGGGNFSRNDNRQNYSRDSGSYSGSYSGNQGGYDNYKGTSQSGGRNYGYDDYNQGRSFDSAGTYGGNHTNPGYNNERRGNYSGGRGNYNDNKSSYDNRNFDSAGSYSTSYEQNSKRPKTYDSFQQNRTTYADQYVQEEQHNQQYHGRGNYRGRGRGHSNYNRGGRNHY
ncbi:protein FAM98A isoform X1 [Tribolium madens]|uniref:protein FAM98A isoform X1 n=1 Tax=Tribolium madens TaxID=41895 RepID=UPI001CF75730|nr:protein FAM98A isoform X1 [Tribolium madens]